MLWFKRDKLTPQGDTLIDILHHAMYYGLVPDDYHVGIIDELYDQTINKPVHLKSLIQLDVMMTDGLFAMAHHLRYGRLDKDRLIPRTLGTELDSSLLIVVNHSINRNTLSAGLQKLEPQYYSYQLLKKNLRARIDSLEHHMVDSASSFEMTMQIHALTINMEQWRWENPDVSRPYVFVNIPSYRLGIMENDSVVFESNVVVGAPYSQTPTLDARLTNLVLYPYWNVPRDIATQELLPKIKRDSTYLALNKYRVLDMTGRELHPDSIRWEKHHVNNFPFMIQQSEGAHNALGIVKFNFVNDFNVYLHDTNAKKFFSSEKRAYSHGCIRVERAIDMAEFLVSRDNPYGNVRDLHRILKEEKQQQVNVDPIELRIRYFTCDAGADGVVRFYEDVYKKNAPLEEAFFCRENSQGAYN
jgi:murein L,D-transpeptidase YcbB/YkuD